ncbi:glycosyltransferase family 4 protein [Luteolibacter flavescens]|uniref:Glycosyltransferase family 4 protein n=1 Tax=Luteolibacter flavescens TaxID=1859460 RepID=A0ABT3FWG4_9BACT|nr:glycosyltransferase family 4 protein [Luteolibacter flavescens]MCW1887320.1 glycosyltransferase family 4 protein [Luteolibacter flavescens]
MKLVALAYLQFGPYHAARLRACQNRTPGWQVAGIGMAATQSEYAWEQASQPDVFHVAQDVPLEQVSKSSWPGRVRAALASIKPDVCAVAGYSHPAMLSLIRECSRSSIPWILMSDSQEIDEPRRAVQEFLKSRIAGLASAGFAAGSPHVDYLEKLGLPRELCSTGYDVVDNDHFSTGAARWRAIGAGPGSRNYFLASNRFIAKKNLHRMLEAYRDYSHDPVGGKNAGTWDLCLLGDGELKAELLTACGDLGLQAAGCAPWEQQSPPGTAMIPTVFFPGFRQIQDLPRFYAGAGAFVHASTTEQWGLVVNEAMASSLPVLVSERCGCARDLVSEGENGWTFAPWNVAALSSLMARVSALGEAARKEMGEASRRIIGSWSPERFADGLIQAAGTAFQQGAKPASAIDLALIELLIRR